MQKIYSWLSSSFKIVNELDTRICYATYAKPRYNSLIRRTVENSWFCCLRTRTFIFLVDDVADFFEDIYELVLPVLAENAFSHFFHLHILVNMDIFSRRYLNMIFSRRENLYSPVYYTKNSKQLAFSVLRKTQKTCARSKHSSEGAH